ncbi:T9SS type A sorting domain-containing protein [Flavisolibacter nicotianae]|uniref:T9SS type A sorting domain-containing protein n=1 Tax=Flavisolibacter nicotianae TaxID=2364882 RepID=UPI0013C4B733|nr:T9SS type A sorting domain-containing protein [Flavisolibacter nicotianae]
MKILLLSCILLFMPHSSKEQVTGRDPLKWPFAKTSIWNMPIHKNAVYTKAHIVVNDTTSLSAEEDIVIQTPNEPMMPVYKNWSGWDSRYNRCRGPVYIDVGENGKDTVLADGTIYFYAPIPRNWIYAPETWNVHRPDACTAILLPNGSFEQTNPIAKCYPDTITSATHNYPPDSCVLKGECIRGEHGGSGLSSIGGTIRYDEISAGIIPHALKFLMWGALNYYKGDVALASDGHRWPATKEDHGYKNIKDSFSYYGSTDTAMRIGALLAIHRNINLVKIPEGSKISTSAADTCLNCTGNLLQLESLPGMIIAKALQDYGAYAVDNSARDEFYISVERNANGRRVIDEFTRLFSDTLEIGPGRTSKLLGDTPWGRDIKRIFKNLFVISNNTGPDNIGGGPTADTVNRRAPMAPEFYPFLAPGQSFTHTAFTPDGKIIGLIQQAGLNRIYRYNLDKTLDLSFGNAGMIDIDSAVFNINPVFSDSNLPAGITVDKSERIIVAEKFTYHIGSTPVTDYFLRRYNSNGTVDVSFAKNGKTDAIAQDNPFYPVWFGPLAVQNDNKIVMTSAHYARSGYSHYISLIRLNSNGSIDFTTHSDPLIQSNGDDFVPMSLLIKHDGKIVLQAQKYSYSYVLNDYVDSMLLLRLQSDGSFDPTFGKGGAAIYDLRVDRFDRQRMAEQSDGKIVVATHDNKLVRFRNDGTIDASFGLNGVVQGLMSPANKLLIHYNDKTLIPDDKILVGGGSGGNFAIARLNKNGSVDRRFGTEGMITTDFGGTEAIENMALIDDQIYVYGNGLFTTYENTPDFIKTAFQKDGKLIAIIEQDRLNKLYRFNTNGTPDASFGNGGVMIIDSAEMQNKVISLPGFVSLNILHDLALDSNGRIIVAEIFKNWINVGAYSKSYRLTRFDSNGNPDNSFGSNGSAEEIYSHRVDDPTKPIFQFGQLAIQSDNKPVLTYGYWLRTNNTNYTILLRLNEDGTADLPFNTNPTVPGVLTGYLPAALVIQHNGRIVVQVRNTENNSVVLAGLTTDGSIDLSFGGHGTGISSGFGAGLVAVLARDAILVARNDFGTMIKTTPDGFFDPQFSIVNLPFPVSKVVAANSGQFYLGGTLNGDFALARYNDSQKDPTFGNDGIITSDFGGTEGIENMALVGKIMYAYGNGILTSYPTSPCVPPVLRNDLTIVLDASCTGNDGQVSLLPLSGTPPFLYSLNGGTSYVEGPNSGYSFQNLAAGIYQLRIKDADGCESDIVTREIRKIYGGPLFRNDGTIVLDASCGANDGNISIIPTCGAAPFMYSIDGGTNYVEGPATGYTFQNLAPGRYQLRLKDNYGNESAIVTRNVRPNMYGPCAFVSTVRTPAGVGQEVQPASVQVYPNPGKGLFRLSTRHFVSTVAQMTVLDAQGNVVQQKQVNTHDGNSYGLDLRGKAKGVYLVRFVGSKGEALSTRIIIQ